MNLNPHGLSLGKEKRERAFIFLKVFILFLFAGHSPLHALANDVPETKEVGVVQQSTANITGVVVDNTGEPLIGVSVLVKGTATGTITDLDGKFSIKADPNATLVFSFIGYTKSEVKVDKRTQINVTLAEDAQTLDEVLVVGYATVKKVNYSGAVSMASGKDLESRPITSVSAALAGLGSGVSVRQTSGKPGDDNANIRMRGIGSLGNQDPLVVIDGVEGAMNSVNPNDIENISFLKDAASGSIYGAKGSNGVILITTKKGAKGAARISYSGTFSFEKPANIYEYVSDYPTHMRLINEAATNFGRPTYFSQESIDKWTEANKNPNGMSEYGVPNWLAYPNTNWADTVFETNLMQTHNLSISGATDDISYSMSGLFMDNPGIMQVTGLQRYQLRANLEAKVAKVLTIGTRTFGSQDKREMGNTETMFNYLNQTTPGLTPYHNGKYGYREDMGENAEISNMLHLLNGTQGYSRTTRINTTWYAKLQLMKGLMVEGTYNYQEASTLDRPKSVPLDRYSMRAVDGILVSPGQKAENLSVTYKNAKEYSYTLEGLIRYNTTIAKDHNLGAFVAYQRRYFNEESQRMVKKGLIDPDLTVFDAVSEMQSIDGMEAENATASYFGRINYDYKGRYMVEANFRYDGTSKADKDNRWGFFPSFSGAWRVTEEPFMEGVKDVFSNIKLRASWGQLGNVNNVGNYDYQAVYEAVNYPFGNAVGRGLRQSMVANPLLKWENSSMTDIGLEFTTLNNRLNVELGWYNKLTENMLGKNTSQYLSMGTISPATMNLYSMKNNGFEVTATWKDRINKFNYSVSGNFAYNKNEITKYQGTLVAGWFDANGKAVAPGTPGATYKSNIGQVSSYNSTTNSFGTTEEPYQRRLEGHMMDEFYLHTPYQGNGTYKNADGSVNIHGGPKDGMLRTPQDLQWAKDMVAAGHQFHMGIGQSLLWYGDYIYADNNGDGNYGLENDQVFQGTSSIPKYTFGLNVSAEWKGFDFSMQWAGAAGFKYFWYQTYINGTSLKNGSAIGLEMANDHYYYNEANPNDPANNIHAKYPRLRLESRADLNSTTHLYDASYIKLKNLQIGYTLPKQLVSKIYLTNLRIFLSGENLCTITSFPGLDPEIGSAATAYPTMKQYAFGVNLTF